MNLFLPVISVLQWLLLAVAPQAPAAQALQPLAFSATLSSIKANIRPGQVLTRQFQLAPEPGQSKVQFRARVEDWWRSRDGRQSFFAEAGTIRRSCAPWAVVNPVESTASPDAPLVVRVTVTVPRELGAGGYWCVLTVDEVPDPLATPSGVGVKFLASVSTGIFLYADPVDRTTGILDLAVSDRQAVVTVKNLGNAPLGIEGTIEFFAPGRAEPVASIALPRTTVLPEPVNEGEITVPLPAPSILAPGAYRMRAILDVGADKNLGAEKDVVVR